MNLLRFKGSCSENFSLKVGQAKNQTLESLLRNTHFVFHSGFVWTVLSFYTYCFRNSWNYNKGIYSLYKTNGWWLRMLFASCDTWFTFMAYTGVLHNSLPYIALCNQTFRLHCFSSFATLHSISLSLAQFPLTRSTVPLALCDLNHSP